MNIELVQGRSQYASSTIQVTHLALTFKGPYQMPKAGLSTTKFSQGGISCLAQASRKM